MPNENNVLINNKVKRILFLICALLLMYLISFLMDPYSEYWDTYFDRSKLDILLEWGVSFIFCLAIYESVRFVGLRLNKIVPWTKSPGKRILIETLSTLVIILTFNFLMILYCSVIVYDDPIPFLGINTSIEETKGLLQWILASIIVAFVIMGVNVANQLILDWKNEALRASRFNQMAIEAELQVLKFQIDPHFVFNNLSVLSELILEDQQLGYQYTENFSKIYRYMLINSKKDLISVEDEIKFLNSYIFLLKHRIGDGVIFKIDIDTDNAHLYMPPLTLQLLVENAMKHNKTLKSNPLVIRIWKENNSELIVENNLLPLERVLDSSGIGLDNINKRYQLLCNRLPEIVQTDQYFRIILPLIAYD